MDKSVLDLVTNKKISDFADVIKTELRQRVMNNEYISGKKSELEKYTSIGATMSNIVTPTNME